MRHAIFNQEELHMTSDTHFSPMFFNFLTELEENNNREWFQENKTRYEAEVRDPLLAFVAEFGPLLREISPHYIADPRPVGGSIFRVYRDVRFSKDKTPYHTKAWAHFRHDAGKDVYAPGFYVHLAPGEVFAGGGMWHPDSKSLSAIRDAIVEDPDSWRGIVSNGLSERFEIGGESLKRAPKGYDPDHPLIDDLKRKDFIASRNFTEEEACSAGFVELYAEACREASPFMKFLANAVGVSY